MTNNPIERLRELEERDVPKEPLSATEDASRWFQIAEFYRDHRPIAKDLAQALTDCQGELEEKKDMITERDRLFDKLKIGKWKIPEPSVIMDVIMSHTRLLMAERGENTDET